MSGLAGLDAVFLDRDGTINRKAPEGEYVTSPDELELLPSAAAAIALLNAARVPVVVVTNQRGVALGRMTAADLDAVHARLHELLAAAGAHVDAVYACPHDVGACTCRKPAPGLLLRAARELGLRLPRTALVGDADADLAAARAVGALAIRVGSGGDADRVAADLGAAVRALAAGVP